MAFRVFPVVDNSGSWSAEVVEVVEGYEIRGSPPQRVNIFRMFSRFGTVVVEVQGLSSANAQVCNVIFRPVDPHLSYSLSAPLGSLLYWLLVWILFNYVLSF